tara:strand:- start:10204 stop:10374 length:171 start_codon:yes stop_codon:yes gene_type:complete
MRKKNKNKQTLHLAHPTDFFYTNDFKDSQKVTKISLEEAQRLENLVYLLRYVKKKL